MLCIHFFFFFVLPSCVHSVFQVTRQLYCHFPFGDAIAFTGLALNILAMVSDNVCRLCYNIDTAPEMSSLGADRARVVASLKVNRFSSFFFHTNPESVNLFATFKKARGAVVPERFCLFYLNRIAVRLFVSPLFVEELSTWSACVAWYFICSALAPERSSVRQLGRLLFVAYLPKRDWTCDRKLARKPKAACCRAIEQSLPVMPPRCEMWHVLFAYVGASRQGLVATGKLLSIFGFSAFMPWIEFLRLTFIPYCRSDHLLECLHTLNSWQSPLFIISSSSYLDSRIGQWQTPTSARRPCFLQVTVFRWTGTTYETMAR